MSQDFFPVTSVCREDFEESGFDASLLTDDEMVEVAERLAEVFLESGYYWECLRTIGREKNLQRIKSKGGE